MVSNREVFITVGVPCLRLAAEIASWEDKADIADFVVACVPDNETAKVIVTHLTDIINAG